MKRYEAFRSLEAVVQVLENNTWWRTIAAFDILIVAKVYAQDCKTTNPWLEYRAMPVNKSKR